MIVRAPSSGGRPDRRSGEGGQPPMAMTLTSAGARTLAASTAVMMPAPAGQAQDREDLPTLGVLRVVDALNPGRRGGIYPRVLCHGAIAFSIPMIMRRPVGDQRGAASSPRRPRVG